jgi:hypothetical protein
MLTYLHHKQQRVKYNEHHDEIFERSWHNNSPNLVFEAVSFAGHVPFKWPGSNCEVDTRFLYVNQDKRDKIIFRHSYITQKLFTSFPVSYNPIINLHTNVSSYDRSIKITWLTIPYNNKEKGVRQCFVFSTYNWKVQVMALLYIAFLFHISFTEY